MGNLDLPPEGEQKVIEEAKKLFRTYVGQAIKAVDESRFDNARQHLQGALDILGLLDPQQPDITTGK